MRIWKMPHSHCHVENMPIKSAKIVAEKLPAMIQKAFGDYADCKVGFNRDKKRDNE